MTGPLRVAEVWRYPVKSLGGEVVDAAVVGEHGVTGDRQWALFGVGTGFGLTARRVPELLHVTARCTADGGVQVVLPDGTPTADDAALSAWLGRSVVLRPASSTAGRPRYESPDDEAAAEGPVAGW